MYQYSKNQYCTMLIRLYEMLIFLVSSVPTLPYQGAVRLRSLKIQPTNTDTITEFTGAPSGKE